MAPFLTYKQHYSVENRCIRRIFTKDPVFEDMIE